MNSEILSSIRDSDFVFSKSLNREIRSYGLNALGLPVCQIVYVSEAQALRDIEYVKRIENNREIILR